MCRSSMQYLTALAIAMTLTTAACEPATSDASTITPAAQSQAGDSTDWLGDGATDFAAPGMAPGARMAVMHGNPADTGHFVIRLDLPDGYHIPPHWHPTTELVTVLEGTFVVGMGERADRLQTRALAKGGVIAAPAKMPHFAWADGRTVVQVHGLGPFQLNLVSQAAAR